MPTFNPKDNPFLNMDFSKIEERVIAFYMKDEKMEDAPKLVIHKLCGEPVFYYFGTHEDAEQLRNFDDITTLEGDAIVPEDIMACKSCGEKIRLNQIQIAVHERKMINNIYTDEPLSDEVKKIVQERFMRLEELKYKRVRDEDIKRMEQEIKRMMEMDRFRPKGPPIMRPPMPPNDFFWFDDMKYDPKRVRKDKPE